MGKLRIGMALMVLMIVLALRAGAAEPAAAAAGRPLMGADERGMTAGISFLSNPLPNVSERAGREVQKQSGEAADAGHTGAAELPGDYGDAGNSELAGADGEAAAAVTGMQGMDHGKPAGGAETFGYAAAKVVSLLAAGIAVFYYTLRIRWMRSAPRMHLMMACMTLAMAAGLTGGTLLTLVTASFSLSAMAAAAACAAAGYMAGSPHGVLPSLEGALAGLMGGLMGGMMGYMSLADHPFAVLAFVDGALAAAAVLLSRLLRECSVLLAAAEQKEPWQGEEGGSFEERLVQNFVGD
ncbi:hypothetical protein [Paenibacillus humicus]|uniref:hypothetical protein n=1 Tax=Paenibacillus humicus TaxID=412861 RepID=UPI000FDA14FA|nr:hypothetical protein [Paenibacillus humicus]